MQDQNQNPTTPPVQAQQNADVPRIYATPILQSNQPNAHPASPIASAQVVENITKSPNEPIEKGIRLCRILFIPNLLLNIGVVATTILYVNSYALGIARISLLFPIIMTLVSIIISIITLISSIVSNAKKFHTISSILFGIIPIATLIIFRFVF